MRRRLVLLPGAFAVIGLLIGFAGTTGAQTVDGLDLAKVRARARLSPQEADALAHVVARRGQALREDAAETATKARAMTARYAGATSGPGGAGTFDFDEMVAASAKQIVPDEAPRLIAFASLSMPAASLKAMIADVSRAGGVVAFRGLPGNSARTFTTALATLLPAGEVKPSIGVDPRLFRAFAVVAVPAYVVTATDFDLCDGFDCRTAVPPHDRLDGNVTLGYALDTIAHGDGPSARVAALYRTRLGEAR